MAIVVQYGPSAATLGAVAAYGGGGIGAAGAQQTLNTNAQIVAQQGRDALQNMQFQQQLAFQAIQNAANRNQQVGMELLGGNINSALGAQQFAQQSALAGQHARLQAANQQQQLDEQARIQAAHTQQVADLNQRNWNIQNAPATFDADENQQQIGHGQYLMPEENSVLTNFMQATRNQQITGLPTQRQMQALQQKIQQGDPQAIQQGLQQGILQFSPQQKQEITRLQDAMSRLDRDPRFSPQDRARAQQMLSQQLQAIRPMQTPPDQMPVDINTKIAKNIGVWTDPTTGKTYPMTIDRNGMPKVLEIPEPKEKTAKDQPKPTSVREMIAVDPAARMKLFNDVRKELYDASPQDDEGNRKIPTNDEVREAVEHRIQILEGFGPPAPTNATPPAASPQQQSAVPPPPTTNPPPMPSRLPQTAQDVEQADAAWLHGEISTAEKFVTALPSLQNDITHIRQVVQQHGMGDMSHLPAEDSKKLGEALENIANFNRTLKSPLRKPDSRSKLTKGAVYGPINGPDGKTYMAIWDGEKFKPIGTYTEGPTGGQ